MSDKLDMVERILKLKENRNAIILAHNYQAGEIQDIADYVGDSLELSRSAAGTDADVIVFCGVHFMAETASILSPDKTVLMPDMEAGCPMADMITAEKLRVLKEKHPNAIVVCYINTSAAVKAESDICCTSTNAVRVINSLNPKNFCWKFLGPKNRKAVFGPNWVLPNSGPIGAEGSDSGENEIIFVPDKYLADYVSKKTGRKLIPWTGFCPTHVKILPEDIIKQKKQHPNAKVIVHPECTPAVIELADEILSTGGMCKYARDSNVEEIIVGTENGILHRLRKENPDKKFYPASEMALCPNMKITTLEKVLWSLEEMKYAIRVPEDIRDRAKNAVDRMLKFSLD